MPANIKRLTDKKLITPPDFVLSGIQYEVLMGSVAYGVSSDTSDNDLYGFCIPPKEIVFPHLSGEIFGFGRQIQRFEQYQIHHISEEDNKKEWDITIYNIVKYFQLCMNNNPNMIDSLFVPRRCVLYTTQIGELVRENRHLFLHKGAWYKFKSYSFSQLHKMKIKVPEGKRKETVDKFGYDIKYAYHLVRLLLEIEMILTEHDLDLERNREMLKSIRKGEWKIKDIENFFYDKEKSLENVYNTSTLQYKPDENKIKQLLLKCLEMYYGSIDNYIKIEGNVGNLIKELETIINKYK